MKDFVISHIKDNDGITPIILMHLTGIDFSYQLLDVYEVEDYINDFLKQDLSVYRNIYVLDLTLSKTNYENIEKSKYKDKFKVFDHHATHTFASIKPFVTIDCKECASSLFYAYLKKIYPIETSCVNTYISLVKSLDLYTFSVDGNKDAPSLSSLLSLYGVDIYIEKMVSRLKEEVFFFDDFEKQWFLLEERKRMEYIEHKCEKIYEIEVEGHKGAIVFAEQYRNELAHYILDKFSQFSFASCINLQGGVSLRGKGELDLSLFARKYDATGGGHKNAAGFAFPKSLQEKIIKELFFDCTITDESN